MKWNFDNSYETLPPIFYSSLVPNIVSSPEIVLWNEEVAKALELNNATYQNAEILAGSKLPDDAAAIAQSYAGHQFGHFTMLGDGRAMLLGELLVNGKHFDLQLKGSGRTPYSRGGDGRAALGPMVREYMISEAMFHLGIPTTRSLSVTKTGDAVYRETALDGAVLCRVASSHLRVGTFEFAYHFGELSDLQALADYAIERHYPQCIQTSNKYETFLRAVIDNQASLIAKWQLVGFVHGVMNTDNMTISGETIDYGPCAFIDTFNPKQVYSSIDRQGRYAFGNQPSIGGWNLSRFAETLLPLLSSDEQEALDIANNALKRYPVLFNEYFYEGMSKKLGMQTKKQGDEELSKQFLQLLYSNKADYTNSFRELTLKVRPATALFSSEQFKNWEKSWLQRLAEEEAMLDQIFASMNQVNPAVIPRNHIVESAISAAVKGDFSLVKDFIEVMKNPYEVDEKFSHYQLTKDDDEPYITYCGT